MPDSAWEDFRNTLLDEGGDLWLWEVLADTENFFPDISPDERLVLAERLIRQMCREGFAYVADGQMNRPLDPDETEAAIASGRWRTFPPAADRDDRLVATPKWEAWSAARKL